jgi:hypothetical protein
MVAVNHSTETREVDRKANSIFRRVEASLHVVMAGLDPAIHVFPTDLKARRGCPAQGRA